MQLLTKSYSLILCLFFLIGAASAQDISFKKKLSLADSLYQRFEEEKSLELYKKILEEDSDRYIALWRASYLYSRIGNRLKGDDRKEEYFNRAIDLAERALAVDSTDTQSNFVLAVAKGRKALISGAKERVAASRAIKKYSERAIRYDSTNAGAWHVLGRWNMEVANLGFFERLAANTLFGGVPDGASEQKAAEYMEKAVKLAPDVIIYRYDLSRVYREMEKEQKAIETCKDTALLKPISPDDPKYLEKCRELIEDLK